jgi:hypothetical protein
MILKYKIHYKFYCVVYSHTIMIYLLYRVSQKKVLRFDL